MPQLIVMSLNVGRLLQEATRLYLTSLILGGEPRPDVMFIQDIAFRDMIHFEWAPYAHFEPMTIHMRAGARAVVGIAIVSQYQMDDITRCTTWGDGNTKVKDLQGVDNNGQRIAPTAENDRLIEATEDRVAICATVLKDGKRFNVATTHGFWVRGGVTNDRQRESTRRLLGFLTAEAIKREGLVLAGDMNFGRGGEIYQMFADAKFLDEVPQSVDNTLDPGHPAVQKGIKVVTDYVMTRNSLLSDERHVVSNMSLRSGVSDHQALLFTIDKP